MSEYSPANNASVAAVNSSASAVTLLDERKGRKGFRIHNASTAILYIKYGADATTSLYTALVTANGGTYECPFQYTGIVTGIWASVNGQANVTELF